MRSFETRGPVYPEDNYIVARTDELSDFIARLEKGRYVVLFAPRQTGKTTFFHRALETLPADIYFPIRIDFQASNNLEPAVFYQGVYEDICEEIAAVFQKRGSVSSSALTEFLDNTQITDHLSMRRFFRRFSNFLEHHQNRQKVVLVIDEFDGISRTVLSDFLYSLRHIYLSGRDRCPHSVGIVGVKSITQLNYDRSISPFNIQDEFKLSNFTLEQVRELLSQYTDEVGQPFVPTVIESIHKQTAGQPVLVNRFAQILTEEMGIPKTEPITMEHFSKAHGQLLRERHTHTDHLVTNIRRDRRFEALLMKIASRDDGVEFNLYNDLINKLATYGVIAKGDDGMCEIINPIYYYCTMQAFKPAVNGLEQDYLPEDTRAGFQDYLTSDGNIHMEALLDNFRDFIARAGFRILQVPETPQEYVGQHLLFAYLEQFVRIVGGMIYLEAQTGRGRMDILILYDQKKYIVETKIWGGAMRYEAGKAQLATYVKLEAAAAGYYVVFDHRKDPEPRVETQTLDGSTIRSYVIPVIQERPSESRKPCLL